MADDERTHAQRLRRMAARQGMRLTKSRSRDLRAPDYNGYMLIEPITGIRMYPPIGKSLAPLLEIEMFLTDDHEMGEWLRQHHPDKPQLREHLVRDGYRKALLADDEAAERKQR